MKPAMHFEIYRTWLKQWRWRLRGANGEIIASGESYKREADCMEVIDLVKRTSRVTTERL